MKTTLKLVALLLVAGCPLMVLADFAGIAVPHFVTAENLLGVFFGALLVLTVIGDYSRRALALAARKPVALATARCCAAEANRLAA